MFLFKCIFVVCVCEHARACAMCVGCLQRPEEGEGPSPGRKLMEVVILTGTEPMVSRQQEMFSAAKLSL